jgi:hypothetical protein
LGQRQDRRRGLTIHAEEIEAFQMVDLLLPSEQDGQAFRVNGNQRRQWSTIIFASARSKRMEIAITWPADRLATVSLNIVDDNDTDPQDATQKSHPAWGSMRTRDFGRSRVLFRVRRPLN